MKAGSISKFLFAISIALGSSMADSHTVILIMILTGLSGLIFWTKGSRGLIRLGGLAAWLFIFLLVFHSFSHPGERLFSILFLTVTLEGVAAGFFYGLKLVAFACSAGIILLTVDPFDLTMPLERVSRLLGPSGRPLASLALALSLALRFMPDLSADVGTTILAFRSRGIAFEGDLARRGRVAVQLLGTVFVNAFKRADTVSMALNVKGYTTRYKKAVYPPLRFSLPGIALTVVSPAFVLWGWLA